jgi:hypothetical protein
MKTSSRPPNTAREGMRMRTRAFEDLSVLVLDYRRVHPHIEFEYGLADFDAGATPRLPTFRLRDPLRDV